MRGFISYAYEERLDNFILTGFDKENKKKWELTGKDAYIHDEEVALTTVNAKAYQEKGAIDIKADKGFINKVNKAVSLRENVILKHFRGATLYTEMLNWNQEKEIVWTDLPLKLVKDANEIVGVGGEVDTNLSRAIIKKDVEFKAVPQTIITSQGPLEIDYLKNVAIFNIDVHVVDRRGELFCDTLIVYFDPEKKGITQAHAKGNVKLRRGNAWSFSQEATYDVAKGNIILLGRPKLEIYPQ